MKPRAPKGFSNKAKKIFREIITEYGITDSGGLEILITGLKARDRGAEVAEKIKKQGVSFRDRFGQLRANPLLSVERDRRAQWLNALKALNLDLEPVRDIGRPPGT